MQIRMLTLFDVMVDTLDHVLEPFGFESRNQFLPEFLLRLADSDTRLVIANTRYYPVESSTCFLLDLTELAAAQFVESLNAKFPNAMAKYEGVGEESGVTGRKIIVDTQALINEIIPLMPNYLDQHPEVVEDYRLSVSGLGRVLKKMLDKYGISTSDTDCFEEAICFLVKENALKAQYLVAQQDMQNNLTAQATALVIDYLGAEAGVKYANDIVSYNSQFDENPDNARQVQLRMTTAIAAAQHIAAYFNRLHPGSAAVLPQQKWIPSKGVAMTIINIDTNALLNPSFLSDLEDTIRMYPVSVRDNYRKQSRTILKTTQDCIASFLQLKSMLIENKAYSASNTLAVRDTLIDLMQKIMGCLEHMDARFAIDDMPACTELSDKMADHWSAMSSHLRTLQQAFTHTGPQFRFCNELSHENSNAVYQLAQMIEQTMQNVYAVAQFETAVALKANQCACGGYRR